MVYKSIFRTALLLVIFPLFTFGQTLQKTWESLPGLDGGAVLQFETDGNRLYALTYGGIYSSQNDGETWALLEGSRNVADFGAQLEVEAGVFYVLKGNGVLLRSLNNGATWKAVLQAPYPIDAPGGRPEGMMAIGDTLLVISALGIYPNPSFGQSTLSSPTFITEKIFLRVFDTAGKLMKEQTLPPGQSWDIQLNLPAGIYLWQIAAPEGVYTLKWLKNN